MGIQDLEFPDIHKGGDDKPTGWEDEADKKGNSVEDEDPDSLSPEEILIKREEEGKEEE